MVRYSNYHEENSFLVDPNVKAGTYLKRKHTIYVRKHVCTLRRLVPFILRKHFFLKNKEYTSKYRISSYSFRRNYSFLNLEIQRAEVFYVANYQSTIITSKNMSKNLSFCCFRDKKCMKMSSLFTLLRFFDELFDVITFWRCKKTSAHEIWGVSLIQYKFRMVLNPLYWTEGNISWSKSNISRMKQCTSYSWKLFWAVWEFRFMSMYFCIKSVILKSFGMYILKYFTKMILPIQFL